MWPGYFKLCYMYFKLFFFFGKSTLMTGFLKEKKQFICFYLSGQVARFFSSHSQLAKHETKGNKLIKFDVDSLVKPRAGPLLLSCCWALTQQLLELVIFLSFTSLYFICFWLAGLIEADMARRLLNNYNLVNQLDFSAELIENTIRSCSTIDNKVSVDDVIDELKGHL